MGKKYRARTTHYLKNNLAAGRIKKKKMTPKKKI